MAKSMQNVKVISAFDIPKIVKRHWEANEPVIFFGSPGIGKSAQIYSVLHDIAKEKELKYKHQPTIDDWEDKGSLCVNTILTSQLDELDTKGGLWIQKREGKSPVATFTSTDIHPEVGTGCNFYDEFANGQPHIMNALQPILLERIAGNKKVSSDIRFVLASNKQTDNTGANPIPMALRSRMASYEVELMGMEEWLKIMRSIGKPIDKRIEAFLKTFERYYYNFDPKKTAIYAYACPRTHDKTSHMIKDVTNMKEISDIYAGWAGQDVGDAFHSFMRLSASVNMEELMANPKKIAQHEDDIGKLYSICISLVDRGLKSKDAANKVFRIMDAMSRDEFGLYIFNNLMQEMGKNKLLTIVRQDSKNMQLMTRYAELFE